MRKLQVLIDNKWQYVFCYSQTKSLVLTTDKSKALPPKACFAKDDLDYFSSMFSSKQFKLTNLY
jgi:GH18 family chitinase